MDSNYYARNNFFAESGTQLIHTNLSTSGEVAVDPNDPNDYLRNHWTLHVLHRSYF